MSMTGYHYLIYRSPNLSMILNSIHILPFCVFVLNSLMPPFCQPQPTSVLLRFYPLFAEALHSAYV